MKAIVLGLCTAFLLNDLILNAAAMTKGIPYFEPRNSTTIAMSSTAPSTSPSPLGYAKKLQTESLNTLKTAKNLNEANIAPKLGVISYGMKATQSIPAEIAPKMIASSAAPTVSSHPSMKLERYAATVLNEKLYVYSQLPSNEQPTVSPSPFYVSKADRGTERRKKMDYPQMAPKVSVRSVAPTVSPAPSFKTNGTYYRSKKLLIFPKPPYTEKPSVSPPPSKEYEAALGVKRRKGLPSIMSTTSKSAYRGNHADKNRTAQEDDNSTAFPSVSPSPSALNNLDY